MFARTIQSWRKRISCEGVQSSVITGVPYSMTRRAQLATRQHASQWWISQSAAELIGVQIHQDQRHLGYVLPSGNVLYNVDQTDHEAALIRHAGNIYPQWLLNGRRVRDGLAAFLFSNIATYESNLWISMEHVQKLGLGVPTDVDPMSTQLQFEGLSYLNAGSITKTLLQRLDNMWPRSASSGRKYPDETAFGLFREAIQKKYASPYWITARSAEKLHINVQKEAKPVRLKASEWSTQVYNATQTENPDLIRRYAIQQESLPRNALTGYAYPEHIASRLLSCAVRSNLPCSLYWLNKREANIIGVSIYDFDDDRCVKIKTIHEELCTYNANVTSNPEVVNFYAKQKWMQSDTKKCQKRTILVKEPLKKE